MTDTASSENGNSESDVAQLLSNFLTGSEEAGDEILALSARGDGAVLANSPVSRILEHQITNRKGRINEIACGIIANLSLFDYELELLVSDLDVVKLLIENCCTTDDPDVVTECLRAFSNMIYVGKGSLIGGYLMCLCKFSLLVAENSLSGRLLTQLTQLVYYIHVYGSYQGEWYDAWDTSEFFCPLLLANYEMPESRDPNMELLPLLKAERLGDLSGLGWLLLCLDAVTSHTEDSPKLGALHWQQFLQADWLPAVTVKLLLGSQSSGWDSAPAEQATTMNTSEQFLILSILENVVSYRADGGGQIGVNLLIRSVLSDDGTAAKFLYIMLELFEEAVFMRDAYAVCAVVYLTNTLYAQPRRSMHEEGDHEGSISVGPTITAPGAVASASATAEQAQTAKTSTVAADALCTQLALTVYGAVERMVEALDLPGNLDWAVGKCSDGEFSLRDMLEQLHAIFTAAGQGPDTASTKRPYAAAATALVELIAKLPS